MYEGDSRTSDVEEFEKSDGDGDDDGKFDDIGDDNDNGDDDCDGDDNDGSRVDGVTVNGDVSNITLDR